MDHSPRPASPSGQVSIGVALGRMRNVMHAVILRDIRSRYFNHGLGFLIQPLMPVAHVLILLTIYTVIGRQAIFGDDLFLFFATGLVPALTFTYISRFMAVSILSNKGMLAFPAVHLLDIVLARSFLELIGIIISIFVMTIILLAVGSDPSPQFPMEAMLAMVAISFTAVGVGIIVSVISAITPFFATFYALFMAVVYLSSGGPIYLNQFPEEVSYYCSFNPIYHGVLWVRSAYYLGYPTNDFSKLYLVAWAMGSVCIGLLMERGLKRFILEN